MGWPGKLLPASAKCYTLYMTKPFILIESPFSAPTMPKLVHNVQYALLAVRDSLSRGEAPYASHLFYTQMLDDNNAVERQHGIDAGLTIGHYAQQSAVYNDFGISSGMEYGIKTAKDANRQVITRSLFPDAKSRQEAVEQMLEEYSHHDLPTPEVLEAIYGRILNN